MRLLIVPVRLAMFCRITIAFIITEWMHQLAHALQAIGCLVGIRGPPQHPAFEFQTITHSDALAAAGSGINDDIILRCCIALQVLPSLKTIMNPAGLS